MMSKGCAIVTGGSRGIGEAISLELSQMGLPVLINYNSNESAAKNVLDKIEPKNG